MEDQASRADGAGVSSSTVAAGAAGAAGGVLHWRLLGLVLWLLVTLPMLPRALAMGGWRLNDFGGAFATLNYPGPKVWAVPLLQRTVGYGPGSLGVSLSVWVLVHLLAIWLLTTPDEKRPSALRLLARWLPIVGIGGLFGTLLHSGSIRTHWWSSTNVFALAAVAVEIAGTALVYLYLSRQAVALGRRRLGRSILCWGGAATAAILLALPAIVFAKAFGEGGDDWPVQAWGAVYGVVTLTLAVGAITVLLQLAVAMFRATRPRSIRRLMQRYAQQLIARPPICADCGYDLRGLAEPYTCPECGCTRAINRDPLDSTRREAGWAALVTAGLAIWLAVTAPLISLMLRMDFHHGLGGSVPLVNFPGPKVWATCWIQRIIGRFPDDLGVHGAMYGLLSLLAVVLITWPRVADGLDEPRYSLRRIARFVALIGAAGFFGFTLVNRGLEVGYQGFWKWPMLALLIAELPGTVCVYLYLAQVAIRNEQAKLARTLRLVAYGSGGLMAAAAIVLPLDWAYVGVARVVGENVLFGGYMAGAVVLSLVAAASLLRLMHGLLPAMWRGLPRRLRAL